MLKLIVTNMLAVGLTENAADNGFIVNDPITLGYYQDRPARGVVTTRNDGMLIQDVRFYDWPAGTVGFMDCSHCEHDAATDTGARTAYVQGVYWSPTFQGRKIQYNIPQRGIFRDIDGTLTGQIGWATYYFPHNDVPECTRDETNFNGLICTDQVQVRRIVFYGYSPNLFDGVSMYIFNCNNKTQGAILSNDQCNTTHNTSSYDFGTQASTVFWRPKQNPAKAWAVAFVTGYTYNPYWGPSGIDWDAMNFQNTPVYNTSDKVITLALNHSEYRETFDFTSGKLNLSNRTSAWTTAGSSCKYGDWQHDWTNKRLFVCINGNQIQSGINATTNATQSYNVTNQPFKMTSIKCRVNCPKSMADQAREDRIRNWSVDDDWIDTSTNGSRRILSTTINKSADEVTIPPSWRMRVDVPRIPETPGTSFKRLEIQGDLVIDEEAAAKNGYIEIYAEVIWIRGNLLVGSNLYNTTTNTPLSEIQPYDGKLKIYLTGSRNADGLTLSQGSSPGNKVLAATGMIYMVGKPRSLYFTKLAAPAKAGDTSIVVLGDASSWIAGSLLGISPTAKNISEFEYLTVTTATYDSATNQTTINIDTSGAKFASFNRSTGQALQYDHYGCTTDESIPGVASGHLDVRADVALLTREITITANELDGGTAAIDGWGASIYTSEVFFPDVVTNTFVAERGSLKLDNVQCEFCGQSDTYQAAIHVENFGTDTTNPAGYVKNSAFFGSNGVAATFSKASDFVLDNNVFFQFTRYGLYFNADNTNLQITNNLIIGVGARNTTTGANHFTDLAACVYSEYNLLGNSSFTNNIAAGCYFHGYIFLGAVCGTSWVYKNNVARISDYPFFIKAPNGNCTYASGMIAYGGNEAGIIFVYTSQSVYVDNIISVDSNIALVINQGTGDNGGSSSPSGYASVENAFIGGPYYPYSACASTVKSRGLSYGGCSNKIGFYIGVVAENGKELPPTPSKLPWYGIMATGAWGGIHKYNNVQVKWFEDNSDYNCKNNYLIQSNDGASDNSAVMLLSNFTKTNVKSTNIMQYTPPGAGWIGIDNCGNWPCTGIKNILVKDTDGSLTGTSSVLIPQNDGVVDSTCRLEGILSYHCSSTYWALLVFQSLDIDRDSRIISPINVTSDGFTNDLNTMMDNCWDGFYTCLKRLSRFPTLVRTGKNYNINAQGTLPTLLQFTMFGANDTDYVLVNIHYTQGTAVLVKDKSGNDIKPKILGPNEDASFTSATCGAFTYQPSSAFITVKITGSTDCVPTLYVSNTVYANVRYPMTVDEFYSVDGATKFIDNIAAVLGIPSYKIRVVSIDRSSNSSKRLLTNSRILIDDSEKAWVQALVILPDADQTVNSTSAAVTAQSYISLLTSAVNSGALAINGKSPDSASFTAYLSGNSTATSTDGSSQTTTIIVIAVVIPVFVVTLAIVGYVCYKKSKLKKKVKAQEKLEAKSLDTIQHKIAQKPEHHVTDEDHSHNQSNIQLNQNNSMVTESHVRNPTDRIIVDNKMIGDRILVDNGVNSIDSPNKITILPKAKDDYRL